MSAADATRPYQEFHARYFVRRDTCPHHGRPRVILGLSKHNIQTKSAPNFQGFPNAICSCSIIISRPKKFFMR